MRTLFHYFFLALIARRRSLSLYTHYSSKYM